MCGTPGGRAAEAVAASRAALRSEARSTYTRIALGAAIAIAVCTSGLFLLTREAVSSLAAGAVLALAVCGSLAAAAAPLAFVSREDRPLCFVAWARALWCLHLPWLVIPACTVLVAAIGFWSWAMGEPAGPAVVAACLLGLFCWALLLALALWLWSRRWYGDLRRLGLGEPAVAAVGVLAALAVLAGAAAVGLAGGIAGGLSVFEWFEPGLLDRL